jgi:acetyltransferase-like isoleucine patch superfamily enzyme
MTRKNYSVQLRRVLDWALPFAKLRNNQKLSRRGVSIGHRSWVDSAELGQNVRLESDVRVVQSRLGDYTYIGQGCQINHAFIGKFCSIAPYAFIGLGRHPMGRFVSTHPIFYTAAPKAGFDLCNENHFSPYEHTQIGNDVWIGVGAAIKDGVTIGDGAVVGASAVVTKDVPSYAICAGVPARVVRFRFTPEIIQALLALKWWDRDKEWLKKHAAAFRDVNKLIELVQAEALSDRSHPQK